MEVRDIVTPCNSWWGPSSESATLQVCWVRMSPDEFASCIQSEIYFLLTKISGQCIGQLVRWLVSGLISPAGADLLWEKSTVDWLISHGWNQQANMRMFEARSTIYRITVATNNISLMVIFLCRLCFFNEICKLCFVIARWQEGRSLKFWKKSMAMGLKVSSKKKYALCQETSFMRTWA